MQNQINVIIPNSDGSEIPAVIHYPNDRSTNKIIILAHGIFSNKDENGRYLRQAELHVKHGGTVIRFDFRGHGDHSIPCTDVTVSGMILDFHSVLKYAKMMSNGNKNLNVVVEAASHEALEKSHPADLPIE